MPFEDPTSQVSILNPIDPAAIALAQYVQGLRVVDQPLTAVYNLTKDQEQLIDVSQFMSVDITWQWFIGTTRGSAGSGSAGPYFRSFARLALQWEDDAGNVLWADNIEVINEGTGTLNAGSRTGQFMSPVIGSKLRIILQQADTNLTLFATDHARVQITRSLRSMERPRYIGYSSYTKGAVGDDGILGSNNFTAIATGTDTGAWYLDAFDGMIEIRAWCSVAMAMWIWVGAYGLANKTATGSGKQLLFNISIAANSFAVMQLLCPRTNIGVNFTNSSGSSGQAQVLGVRSAP